MSLVNEYTLSQLQSDASLSCKVNPVQLEWEPTAVYHFNMTFDESLMRLREAGYTRHPRPAEVSSFLCDYLGGRLSGEYDTVAQEMVQRGGWLSMAIERKGNSLVCYTDPENLRWDTYERSYIVDGVLEYSDEQVFDISGIDMSNLVSLEKFPSGFTQMLYSRKLSSLPKKMRTEEVFVHSTGIWPISRSLLFPRPSTCSSCISASRGVRYQRR